MAYTKPELVELVRAAPVIQGIGQDDISDQNSKTSFVKEDSTCMGDESTSSSAYEADE